MSGPRADSGGFVRGLSLLGVVALLVGNMVGTSIYTLPATLAGAAGPLSLAGWLVTALGYGFVALVYARLGPLFPRTGGPYVFAREAFGDYAGFLTVWAYWFSATVGNAAIALGVVGYLKGLHPALSGSPWIDFGLAQLLLWTLTGLNLLGVKHGSRLQIAVLFLHLVPLLGVTALCLLRFEPAHLAPFSPQGEWTRTLPAACALIVWAYSGIESATVPAEEVADPARTIRRGTLLGYALATLVFLGTALAVIGVLPNAEIAASEAPLALMAERGAGSWAGWLLRTSAIVAGIGTLNGWILMAGRIPVAAAQDGLFFRGLGRVDARRGTPVRALLIGSAVASATLLLCLSNSLLATFQFVVGLSVLTTLLPHLFAAAAQLMIARRDPLRIPPAQRRRAQVVALLAFVAVLFFVYGCGPDVALWGFLVILAGTPLYVWLRTRPSAA